MDGRPQPPDRLSLVSWKSRADADVGKGTDCFTTRRAFQQEHTSDGGADEANPYDPDCVCGRLRSGWRRLCRKFSATGGNATGFTNAESSLTGKWLGLLKEIMPSINRVAFIFDPKVAPGGGSYYTKLIESAAPSFAVVPTAVPVQDAVGIEGAIGDFANKPDGGLLVLPDATTNLHRELIISLAARYRVPAVYGFRHIAAEGGLISYGIDIVELFRRAATYVDRILKGAKPADLPVQLPEKFQLAINLKTAAAMGLRIPTSLQLTADEMIE